jgi:hypothetical protein
MEMTYETETQEQKISIVIPNKIPDLVCRIK